MIKTTARTAPKLRYSLLRSVIAVPPSHTAHTRILGHKRSPRGHCVATFGSNLNSTTPVVSSEAASKRHFLTASTAAFTNKGWPPTTFVLFTVPFGATATWTFTTPEMLIRRANSGYAGETLDFTLRVISSWARLGEGSRTTVVIRAPKTTPVNQRCMARRD